jgi:hypothetical protein
MGQSGSKKALLASIFPTKKYEDEKGEKIIQRFPNELIDKMLIYDDPIGALKLLKPYSQQWKEIMLSLIKNQEDYVERYPENGADWPEPPEPTIGDYTIMEDVYRWCRDKDEKIRPSCLKYYIYTEGNDTIYTLAINNAVYLIYHFPKLLSLSSFFNHLGRSTFTSDPNLMKYLIASLIYNNYNISSPILNSLIRRNYVNEALWLWNSILIKIPDINKEDLKKNAKKSLEMYAWMKDEKDFQVLKNTILGESYIPLQNPGMTSALSSSLSSYPHPSLWEESYTQPPSSIPLPYQDIQLEEATERWGKGIKRKREDDQYQAKKIKRKNKNKKRKYKKRK